MRSSVGFPANSAQSTILTATSSSSPLPAAALSSSTYHMQHSAWQSPVPYLFGGLAAMLGLIAFALLILACSYWKLSGFLEAGDDSAHDVEAGEANGDVKTATDVKPIQACFEQRIVVIMAGDQKPTFLATPISSRASSFGDNGVNGDGNGADGEVGEKQTEGNDRISSQEQEP